MLFPKTQLIWDWTLPRVTNNFQRKQSCAKRGPGIFIPRTSLKSILQSCFQYLACCATYHHLPKLQKAARVDAARAGGRRKGTHSCLGSDADTCPCCKYSSDTGPAEVCSSIFNYSKHYLYVEGVRFKKQNQINKQNKQTSDEAYFPMLSL